MVIFTEDVKEEFEVTSIYDFMSKVGFKKELKEIFGDTDNIVESDNFSSDQEAIEQVLEADSWLWSINFIETRNDGYWIIRKLNNLASITIPISECDVQEMQDEDYTADWCFDFVDVHLTRGEEEDDEDDN